MHVTMNVDGDEGRLRWVRTLVRQKSQEGVGGKGIWREMIE